MIGNNDLFVMTGHNDFSNNQSMTNPNDYYEITVQNNRFVMTAHNDFLMTGHYDCFNDYFVMIGHNDCFLWPVIMNLGHCDCFVMTGHNDFESHKTQVKQDSSQTTLDAVYNDGSQWLVCDYRS